MDELFTQKAVLQKLTHSFPEMKMNYFNNSAVEKCFLFSLGSVVVGRFSEPAAAAVARAAAAAAAAAAVVVAPTDTETSET